MKQEEREQFFSGQVALGSTWHGMKGMTAQYINECVSKRNGMEVVDKDGDVWGWVYDCHKDVGKWVAADTHDRRAAQMSDGMGQPALLPDYEPYYYTIRIKSSASFAEGIEVNISDPVKPYQHVQVSGYNPAEWKDPGNLPEGQEWCEDCGEGHPTENDPVNPGHYQGFSNGAEVIDITENLTFSAGNAVKYLSRAGRIDGQNKGAILEDLRKAAWYVAREIDRIEAQK